MKYSQCLFCQIYRQKDPRIIFDSKYFFVGPNTLSRNKGHTLIVLKRHRVDIFALNGREWKELFSVIKRTKKYLDKKFKPDGYNIAVNCGQAAGQTVFHTHIHLVPRYKGVKNRAVEFSI